MPNRRSRTTPSTLTAAAFLISGLALPAPASAQDQQPVPEHTCRADLTNPGIMRDVVSNALHQGLDRPESDVRTFLVDAEKTYATGADLLKAAAAHFKLTEAVLDAEVQKFKHCNCKFPRADAPPDDGLPIPAFAKDVTLHVILHEIGHALIREFDLPVLSNEETAADAFATFYLTTYLPERAADVLKARTQSLMIEAAQTPDVDVTGEHDDDARRAFQIAALAMAADARKYKDVAAIVGMSEDDIKKARDYGAEIHRSWRRVLTPLRMPEGVASREARVTFDETSPFLTRLCSDGLAHEVESAIRRFDWHSQVTVRFTDDDGGAGWSRSGRTVTVHSQYVRRFIDQSAKAPPAPPPAPK